MSDLNKILKKLQKRGFTLTQNNGSRGKLYPPDKSKPFYSIHLSGEQKAIFPLRRFGIKNWDIDIEKI